uniref:PGG domain-containing protein n=1 Tax=Aegilops tauschii TaxID=37682 RepID=M8CD00_AEGTA
MADSETPNAASSGNLLPPSHESSSRINDAFELLWGHRKYLVLLGVLAVGVTYNAGLTPPGGSWILNKDGHDAAAFAASLVLIILLLSKSVTNQRMWLHSMQLTMTLDLFSLLGAYAAGSCRTLKSSIYILVLVLAVIIYVGIRTLVSTRFIPRELKQNLQTMINSVLNQQSSLGRQESIPLETAVEEARCCRDLATSFFVVSIFFIVWISFAILAGFFVQGPVANWLQKKIIPLSNKTSLQTIINIQISDRKVASMGKQSSPDDPDMTALSVEQNMSVGQSDGDTSSDIVDEGLSAPVEATGNADSAEQNNLVEDNSPEIRGSHDLSRPICGYTPYVSRHDLGHKRILV